MEITHLLPVVVLDTLEDEQEHLIDDVHNLVVVVLESHLEIETGELGQVPVGVGVLGPEDGTNFVHPLHISGDGHLLSQLGRLGQEGWATEVVDLEDGGTGLGGSGLKLGGLDLGETFRIEEGSEQVRDAGTDTENGVRDWGTEVDDSVGETSSLTDTGVVGIGSCELGEGASGILDLEWKQSRGSSNHMELQIHRRVSRSKR
jgi:hypothetical protein